MSLEKLAEKYADRNSLSDDGESAFIPSGMVMMDLVLSDGKGIPQGKWIQLTSPSGCGKTHISLSMAKAACARGKKVLYIDTENGVNQSQMEGIGVFKYFGTQFFLVTVATFEEAEEAMEEAENDESVDLVIIDSLTGMQPQKVFDESCTSAQPGQQARYMSIFIQKWRQRFSKTPHHPTVFCVNQERTKISFVQTTVGEAGGQAQQYYMDIRLRMKKKSGLTHSIETSEGKQSVEYGVEAEMWATKNRYTAPFVKAIITVIYGKGVSNLAAYQRKLMADKVLTMKGAGFWSLALPEKEEQKARGSEGCTQLIKDNLEAVRAYIDSHGGFTLVRCSEEEKNE